MRHKSADTWKIRIPFQFLRFKGLRLSNNYGRFEEPSPNWGVSISGQDEVREDGKQAPSPEGIIECLYGPRWIFKYVRNEPVDTVEVDEGGGEQNHCKANMVLPRFLLQRCKNINTFAFIVDLSREKAYAYIMLIFNINVNLLTIYNRVQQIFGEFHYSCSLKLRLLGLEKMWVFSLESGRKHFLKFLAPQ